MLSGLQDKQLDTKYSVTQPDGSTPIHYINTWFDIEIRKYPGKMPWSCAWNNDQ
jgi:hypothetical protein